MNRAYDWSPLTGWHGDPVPGDADVVSSHVTIFRQAADQAGQAASRLQGISNTGMSSDQVDKLKSRADALAGKLLLVKSRYEAASTALGRYEPVLRHGQQRSVQLLHEVGPAAAQEGRDRGDSVWLFGRLVVTPEGPDKERLKEEYVEIERRRGKNKSIIEGAQAELRRICEDRNHAADQAKRDIDNAMSNSQLNDGIVDRVKDVLGKIDAFIQKHSEVFQFVGKMLGHISTALTVLSFFCPVLAPFAFAVGVAGALASVVGAYGKARKDGNWLGFAVTAGLSILSVVSGFKAMKGVQAAAAAGKAGGVSTAQKLFSAQHREAQKIIGKSLKGGIVRKIKALTSESVLTTGAYRWARQVLSPKDAAALVEAGRVGVHVTTDLVKGHVKEHVKASIRRAYPPTTVQCVNVGAAA